MTTWATLTAQFTLLLSDKGAASGTPSYAESLRMLAWNRATEYFAITHTALIKTTKIVPSTDGDGLSIAKPAGFLQIAGVTIEPAVLTDAIILPLPVDHTTASQGFWLRQVDFVPGQPPDTTGYIDTGDKLYFPDATITNSTLWYYAFYPQVAASGDIAGVPQWSEWALCNLAIAYMLIPSAIGVADLRRYEGKRDAGQPEDNPSRVQANWHLEQYHNVVNKYKGQYREMSYR